MRHRRQWASGEKANQIYCHVTASPAAWLFPEEVPKARGQLGEFRQKLEEKQACLHPKLLSVQKGAFEMIREGKGIHIYRISSLCPALC